MIPNKIFEMGSMLGLAPEEIKGIVSINAKVNSGQIKPGTMGTNDFSTYKDGTYYGTISINDF